MIGGWRKGVATGTKYVMIPLVIGAMVGVAVLLTPLIASKIGIYLWAIVAICIAFIIMFAVRRMMILRYVNGEITAKLSTV